MSEFNLSDKMCTRQGIQIEGVYDIGDVKEFIKELKENLNSVKIEIRYDTLKYLKNLIDKLAGDKLI